MIHMEQQFVTQGKKPATLSQETQDIALGDGSFLAFLSRHSASELRTSSPTDIVDQPNDEQAMAGNDLTTLSMRQHPTSLVTEMGVPVMTAGVVDPADTADSVLDDTASLTPVASEASQKWASTPPIEVSDVNPETLSHSPIVSDAKPLLALSENPISSSEDGPAHPIQTLPSAAPDRTGQENAPQNDAMRSPKAIAPPQTRPFTQSAGLPIPDPTPAPLDASNAVSGDATDAIAPTANTGSAAMPTPFQNSGLIPLASVLRGPESVEALPSPSKISETSPANAVSTTIGDRPQISPVEPIIAEPLLAPTPVPKSENLNYLPGAPPPLGMEASVDALQNTAMHARRSAIAYDASREVQIIPTHASGMLSETLRPKINAPEQPTPPAAPQILAADSKPQVQPAAMPDLKSVAFDASATFDSLLAMPLPAQPSILAPTQPPQLQAFMPQMPVSLTEVAARIKDHSAPGKPTSVELALAPEELGKIRLFLTPHGDKLRVVIQAERPETMDLLRRNTEGFTAELRQSGFANTTFSFSSWGESHRPPPRQTDSKSAHKFEDAPAAPTSIADQIKASGRTGLDLRI